MLGNFEVYTDNWRKHLTKTKIKETKNKQTTEEHKYVPSECVQYAKESLVILFVERTQQGYPMHDVYFIFRLINTGFTPPLHAWFLNRGLIISMILHYFGVTVLRY